MRGPLKKLGAPGAPDILFASPHTNSQSTGGTGVSPLQAQAKACGYKKLLIECNSVSVVVLADS
jgi:hypothetical protein